MSCELMNPYQYSSFQYHHRSSDSHKIFKYQEGMGHWTDVRLQRVRGGHSSKEHLHTETEYDYTSAATRHTPSNMYQVIQGTDYSRLSETADYQERTDPEVAKHHVASGHPDKHHSGHHSDKHHSSHADKHHGSMTDKQTNLSSLEVKGEKDKDESRAEYISSDCVIFTYFAGDIMDAVNDHFSKALSQESSKDVVPLSARGLPASFWDSSWLGGSPHHAFTPTPDLYQEYTDPWQSYMASMSGYSSAHGMYSRSYSSLLLHHSRRDWIDSNYASYSSYSDGSGNSGNKELSWF